MTSAVQRQIIAQNLGYCSVQALRYHGTSVQWAYAEDLRELASQLRRLP